MTYKRVKTVMKIYKAFIAIVAAAFIVCGCSETETSEKLKVCTSFNAMYDLTRQICGDRAEIKNLVPNGSEPHDWEPSTGAMLYLEKADVFVYNGLGMESFVDKIRASVKNDLVYVEASEGCDILYGYEDSHHHDEDEEEHGEEKGHIEDADPHVWLDPYNALTEAENICEALSSADPENEEYYRENLASFKAKIIQLDLDYKNALADLKSRNIIVSHEAYGYICRAYGLNQSAVEGMSAESEPSPRKVREIYGFIRENNISCIFYEELTGSRTASAISEDLGISLYPISSFEGLTTEQEKQDYDYFDVMRANLESLEKGLKYDD